ncbi:MAG: CBS domain-containing protein [Desulfobacteraceae bacterium]|nr:MAG: CBS domain-containing protein [Desulfobacteraceae bacterium]
MFIDQSMIRKVITIDPEAGIAEAKEKMRRHRIHSLPVISSDRTLIGIVTDRDVRSAWPSDLFSKEEALRQEERSAELKIKDIMTADPVTVSPANTLQDALLLMQRIHVGALPVVDRDGKVAGIISLRDLLRAFTEVLGIDEPGMLLGIVADDQQGQMKRIVDAITEEKIRFGSVLVSRHWQEGKRAFFPYLFTHNVLQLKKKLEALGFTFINPLEWNLREPPLKK